MDAAEKKRIRKQTRRDVAFILLGGTSALVGTYFGLKYRRDVLIVPAKLSKHIMSGSGYAIYSVKDRNYAVIRPDLAETALVSLEKFFKDNPDILEQGSLSIPLLVKRIQETNMATVI